MQGINATIIIQAINFGVAYLILRKLVFEPGVALVLEDRAREARLNNQVSSATEHTELEKARLAVEWATEQKKIVAHIPVLPEELFVLRRIKPTVSSKVLPTEREVAHTQKALTQSLVYSVEEKR